MSISQRFQSAVNSVRNAITGQPGPAPIVPTTEPEYISSWGRQTKSGQRVSAETAKKLATAYRCGNILSDDIASLPFQVFQRVNRQITQIDPDPETRNTAYLMEVEPNRWMSPFIFKKTIILWLIYYGNAYIWEPRGSHREFFILDADKTRPAFDKDGDLWYQTIFPDGTKELLPAVEVLHLMINSTDGLSGKSILTYARETMGRQLGAHDTQDRLTSQGLNPSAAIWVNSNDLKKEARDKVKDSYLSATKGSENAGGVAVFDKFIEKFETISMKPTDAQFLETIQATDSEVANFYGIPLHKLNMGKQSYESNTQQQQDYIDTTLNPYLVQWEQAARLKWLQKSELRTTYMRFIREALLRMNAKERASYMKDKIMSGQMSPNEARQIDDVSAYEGGDAYYVPANMARVMNDGNLMIQTGTLIAPPGEETKG